MKRRMLISLTIVAAVGMAMTQFGTAIQDNHPKATNAEKQFEQLKKLVGKWEGTAMHGEEVVPTSVTYKLTAAGSVIMETLFGGTPEEMITMYHLNGEDLVLTHYCVLRNQPRMKAKPSSVTSTIFFNYVDGTNMDSKDAPHMHSVEFNFVDDDRVETTWSMHAGGTEQSQAKFNLHRAKK